MKQLVVLSGKGGTGKTSVTAAFAYLAAAGEAPVKTVLADADVDAANLELVLKPNVVETHEFIGGQVAIIDKKACTSCGICKQVCRFNAVHEGEPFQIDPIACDGCAACVYQCPVEAIRMESQIAGSWFRSNSQFGPLFHAALKPAQENSGKLVTMVKQQARLLAMDKNYPLTLVDGPPGIGCPVISAVSGADLALVVAEPTAAGTHDMVRVLETADFFDVRALVCINKADIYPNGAAKIEQFCMENKIELVGSIPFDQNVTEAMIQGKPVTEHMPNSAGSLALKKIWEKILLELEVGADG